MANKHTMSDLYQMQSLPLKAKIQMTRRRIDEWVNEYGEDGVYISFSGGKDSTVLLDIARKDYPDLKAVFVDTGLEYPEIRSFVKRFNNVDWIKPQITFKQVVEKYGYPFISKEVSECVDGARKYLRLLTDRQTDRQTVPYNGFMADMLGIDRRKDKENEHYLAIKTGNIPKEPARYMILNGTYPHRSKGVESGESSNMYDRSRYKFFLDANFNISSKCCKVMKKNPTHKYGKETGRKPITAQMASESRLRTQKWLQNGCNGFDLREPISNPMSFWFEEDVLLYCYKHNIEICSVYGDIVKDNEVEGQYDFEDLGIFDLGRPQLKTTGCDRTGCVFCGFGCHIEKNEGRFVRLKRTHPKLYDYVMRPWEQGGLNYKEVIDWINEHGNFDIRY